MVRTESAEPIRELGYASPRCSCSCSMDTYAAEGLVAGDAGDVPSHLTPETVDPEGTSSPFPYSVHSSRFLSALCSADVAASLSDLEGNVKNNRFNHEWHLHFLQA